MTVFAESISTTPSSDLSVSGMPTPSIIDYQLPYPGLLPDNSFYFLKVLRDRIESFLISKPLSKASFNLLQSDKRMLAAYMVLNEHTGKIDLSISTFSKGENYFEEGIENLLDAKRQGMEVGDLQQQFLSAHAKHVEVLHNMELMVSNQDRKKFSSLEMRLDAFGREMRKWKNETSR